METAGKKKKHWFLKGELVVLVCVTCIWVAESVTTDIKGTKGEYDRGIQDHTEVLEIDPNSALAYGDSGEYDQQVRQIQSRITTIENQAANAEERLSKEYEIELRGLQAQYLTDKQYHNKKVQLDTEYELKAMQLRQEYDQEIQQLRKIQSVAGESTRGVVSGVLYSDDPSALIDTQILKAGDAIHGVTIVKILEDRVEFEKNGRRWTQQVGEIPAPEWQQP
ncbi:MAG: hypothetical protein ACYTEL_11355 [Planctomycetota bacterium]|jgi:hypothetical protein